MLTSNIWLHSFQTLLIEWESIEGWLYGTGTDCRPLFTHITGYESATSMSDKSWLSFSCFFLFSLWIIFPSTIIFSPNSTITINHSWAFDSNLRQSGSNSGALLTLTNLVLVIQEDGGLQRGLIIMRCYSISRMYYPIRCRWHDYKPCPL